MVDQALILLLFTRDESHNLSFIQAMAVYFQNAWRLYFAHAYFCLGRVNMGANIPWHCRWLPCQNSTGLEPSMCKKFGAKRA